MTPWAAACPFLFKPFIPPSGLEPNVYPQQGVNVLSDAYTLGNGSRSLIENALRQCYPKSIAPDLRDGIAAGSPTRMTASGSGTPVWGSTRIGITGSRTNWSTPGSSMLRTYTVGQTRKVMLRLSRVGRDRFGLDRVPGPGRESIAHKYWKRFNARRLEARGYRVCLEAPRVQTDGRMDILAVWDQERMALGDRDWRVRCGEQRAPGPPRMGEPCGARGHVQIGTAQDRP